jgi:predicted nucleic acid-binding protein
MRLWHDLERERASLFTTDWVFGETVSFVRRRVGYDAARTLGESLRSSSILEIVHADESVVDRAWEAFLAHTFQGLSLVDCVSFVTMRSRRIRRAFTFDGHFGLAGFEVLE